MHISIAADASQQTRPLVPYWSHCVGAGRANEGLRAGWLEQLSSAIRECGFRHIRFHGLFHDDMFVYRIQDGVEIYNWQYLDELFDRLLDMGIRPFVELAFCPSDLARTHATVFWWRANGAPPTDLDAWSRLVESFLRHCISRYGIDEVRQWYFEVWNEPNLPIFFTGTKQEYYELYSVTAHAVKRVDPLLRVGGPSTSNYVAFDRFEHGEEDRSKIINLPEVNIDALQFTSVWFKDFLEYCHREKIPCDFLSTHPYPTDFAFDGLGNPSELSRPANALLKDLSWARDTVKESPRPDLEIHMTEWSSSPSSRDHTHDYPQAATYIVKSNIEAAGYVQSLAYWVFSDIFEEEGAGDSIFHGGFGLLNFQGIAKPAFHAYRFLHKLGDQEIARGKDWIATRSSTTGKLGILGWNYPEEVQTSLCVARKRGRAEEMLKLGVPVEFKLDISGCPPHSSFEIEILDAEHGFALKKWQEMGSPETPDREQTRQLRLFGMATEKLLVSANSNGNLSFAKELPPWAIISVSSQ